MRLCITAALFYKQLVHLLVQAATAAAGEQCAELLAAQAATAADLEALARERHKASLAGSRWQFVARTNCNTDLCICP
jgi:hypothetical protein